MRKLQYAWAWLASFLLMSAMTAQAQIISVSGTNTITWDAEPITTPLVNAVLAGVIGVTTIFVIIMGIKLIFRFFKRAG